MHSDAIMQPTRARRALPFLSSSFSALILALLPKCPFCLVLLLAPLGIKVPGSGWFLTYAILMLAGIPVAFFWSAPCHRGGIRPLILGLIGLGIMTIGRFSDSNAAVMLVGASLMMSAGLWSSRLRLTHNV
jgi:hypothetical protein